MPSLKSYKQFRSAVLVSVTAAAAFLTAGCPTRSPQGPQGHLSIPAGGKVRVVTTKVKDSLDTVHWKWSVIGERNWTKAEVSGTTATLGGTYPLNSTTTRGGCHVWECDLIVRRRGTSDAEWTLILHGSNGTTAKDKGTLPAVKVGDALPVEPVQDRDALLRLPAELRLATMDRKPVTFRIDE